MKKKLSLITTVCMLLLSCSDNSTSIEDVEKKDSGVISNEDITLTYGKSLLNGNIQLLNEKIAFANLTTTKSVSTRAMSMSAMQSTDVLPDLTNAKELTGTGWSEVKDNDVYFIAEGKTFTGGLNFNGKGTLVVLGTLAGNNYINVPNGGNVIVASTGDIARTTNLHLNSGGILDNYGTTHYATNSSDGTINNFSELIFTSDFNLNTNVAINNYCGIIFEGFVQLNSPLNNYSYISFVKGFHINSSGVLNLGAGSLTDIKGGRIGADGKVKNETSEFARVDITGDAIIGNMNAAPAFTGKIDINTSLTFAERKLDSQVLLNANVYIASEGCKPSRGISLCDPASLQFQLTATVSSPVYENYTLSATDVYVNNGKAYVSYHTNDSEYDNSPVGAVRVFDIQDYNNPTLVNEAVFKKMEFNGLSQVENDLYMIGGNKAGARIIHTNLQDGALRTTDLSGFTTYKIPGVAAKTMTSYNNNFWLVSGGPDGGLFKLDKSKNFESVKISNIDGTRGKYLAHNKNVQVFLAVDENGAHLRISDLDGNNAKEYDYSDLIQRVVTGKNTLTMDDDYVYLALSDMGVAKIDLTTGQVVASFQPNNYRVDGVKVFKENGLTNAVAIAECFVLLANGADGVIVLSKDELKPVGSFKLAQSANLVYVKNGLLFVATGRDGLNIIKFN